MATTKYTFWNLINELSIEIPIIQRDYAQGRQSEKVNEIRNGFVKSLYEAINENKNLDFDFIYGSEKKNVLIPLDGQQRLTTLFLLHWYLASKDGRIDEARETLAKFSYKTRISAREFCQGLVENAIDISSTDDESLSNVIADSSWFFLSWKKDPTVQSMLVMLDAIDKKFKGSIGFYDLLVSKVKPPVTFQFISIDNFGLSDNLYIKMNARGKALTEFESFKAKFEQFIEKIHPLKKKEFAKKIDGVWTDLFWKHKEENLIDIPFMRFFDFITEMLYYLNFEKLSKEKLEYTGNIPKINFHIIESVYKSKSNLEFLFNSLDKFYEILDTEIFFNSIFNSYEHETSKVVLFSNTTDLFQKCIGKNGIDIKERILLFSILQFTIQKNLNSSTVNLNDFVRVIRNLLLRVRQRNDTVYNSNLRVDFLQKGLSDILKSLISDKNIYDLLNSDSQMKLQSFSSDSLNFEKQKADIIKRNPTAKAVIHKLEDHKLLEGSIHNFDLENQTANLSMLSNAFYEIWETQNDSLIIRAVNTIDEFCIDAGNSKLDEKYFFGNAERWHTILTITGSVADKIIKVFPELLCQYNKTKGKTSNAKLQSLINDWLNKKQVQDWRYYFIKYPEITSTTNNLYTWKNDFELRNLSGNTLLSYHINPYVRTVAKIIDNDSICELNKCYGQYADESPLRLASGIGLHCKTDGWSIILPDDFKLSKKIISQFSLKEVIKNKEYLLTETITQDRIEIAVDFCNKISN
jgi:hypothetical protein